MKIIRPKAVLDSGGSFTRASTATYYNSSGILSTASVNIPRINYDPITLEHKGLLLEAAATNLLTYSDNFSDASWVKVATAGASATVATFPAINDRITKLVAVAGAITRTFSITLSGSGTITISQEGQGGTYSISSNTVTLTSTPAIFNITHTTNADNTGVYVVIGRYSGSVGTATTVNVSMAQLEVGSSASSYIPTTSATVTRAADVVTGTGLIYSDLPETDYSQWSAGTSYILPTRVIRLTTHKVYECLNVTSVVDAGTPETTPTRWLEVSPTNRWAIFDEQVGTSTTGGTSITYLLKLGRINSLALLELDASNIEVSVVSGTEVVYKASTDLNSANSVGDWYQYFYEPIYQQNALVITNLADTSLLNIPAYGEAVLAVTIRGLSSVSCGVLVAGLSADLGSTQNSPKFNIIDYSRKEPDDFGNYTLVKRKFSKRMSITVMLKSTAVDGLVNILTQYRATPLVWIGADSLYTSLIVYGFYKDFDINIDNILYSYCDFEIEGLS